MKKDKQWLINKVRKACDYEDDNRLNIKSYKMVDLINQLDEPEVLSMEEKVYEVKLEANGYGLTPSSLIVLYESVGGKIILREITKEHYDDSKRRVPNSYYLTEKQIKGYDERFWPFAEPVEELE